MTDIAKNISADLQSVITGFQPQPLLSAVAPCWKPAMESRVLPGWMISPPRNWLNLKMAYLGIAFNLEKSSIGVIIMGEYAGIQQG